MVFEEEVTVKTIHPEGCVLLPSPHAGRLKVPRRRANSGTTYGCPRAPCHHKRAPQVTVVRKNIEGFGYLATLPKVGTSQKGQSVEHNLIRECQGSTQTALFTGRHGAWHHSTALWEDAIGAWELKTHGSWSRAAG